MSNILDVQGLCKSYPDFSLSNVSFSLQEGCITGFIGINGAGKTTTIRTILGLTNKDKGTVSLFGTDMSGNEQELRNRIGVVLDDGSFYDQLTIKEMKSIIAPAYINWSDKDFYSNLERFSLKADQKISSLSKGMRMQFALSLALSHKAEILIMDEPTSGLDPLVRSKLLEMMTDYMEKGGRAVFFSTHITSDLDKIADMLILINDGRIIFEEEKDSLLEKHRIVKGNADLLDQESRGLFLQIQENDYGFSGITRHADKLQGQTKGIVIERPAIEDIMLGYVEGGSVNADVG